MLTTSDRIRSFLEANGLNTGVKIQPFTFDETPPSGGQPANRVVIPYINRGFYEVPLRPLLWLPAQSADRCQQRPAGDG